MLNQVKNLDDPGLSSLLGSQERSHPFDRTQSDFLAQLTHEIRTPLTSLLMGLHLLKKNPAELGDSLRWVDICVEEGERLHHLVEQLLTASRIGQNRCLNPAHQLPTPVRKVVGPILNRLHSETALNEVLFSSGATALMTESSDTEEDPRLLVRCDRERLDWSLGQILTYIIRNGSKNQRIHLDVTLTPDQCVKLNIELQAFMPTSSSEEWFAASISYQLSQGKVSYAGISMAMDLLSAMNFDFSWEKRRLGTDMSSHISDVREWTAVERFWIVFN